MRCDECGGIMSADDVSVDSKFEEDVSEALIKGVKFIREFLEERGWESGYVDLQLTAFMLNSNFDKRLKKVEYEDKYKEGEISE